MAIAAAQNLSLAEFLAQAETKPAQEYLDGQAIQKPMPQGKHSRLQTKLSSWLNTQLEPVAFAFTELRCTFGGRSLVPDIAIFRGDRIPRDETGDIANTFSLAPDWVIEILSPDQRQTRVLGNILHCLDHGSELGWLLDADERSVLVILPEQRINLVTMADAPLPLPRFMTQKPLAEQLTLQELYGWLTLPI